MIGRGRGGECVIGVGGVRMRESEIGFRSGVEERRVGVVFGGEAEGSSVLSAAYELIR
jgi:hypothetical protein